MFVEQTKANDNVRLYATYNADNRSQAQIKKNGGESTAKTVTFALIDDTVGKNDAEIARRLRALCKKHPEVRCMLDKYDASLLALMIPD